MKERPILFSGEMVRAILDGRKTQTRRVIKPQPTQVLPEIAPQNWKWQKNESSPVTGVGSEWMLEQSPFGVPGDELWVRETWDVCYKPRKKRVLIAYRADGDFTYDKTLDGIEENQLPKAWKDARWHPSIHMPRWASRIQLRIKDIRVERVQDITWKDIVAEGIVSERELVKKLPLIPHLKEKSKENLYRLADLVARTSYWRPLWDKLNRKRGYGYERNPWVWVIEFERIT